MLSSKNESKSIENSGLILLPTDSLGGAERVAKMISVEMIHDLDRLNIVFLSRGDNGHWRDISNDPKVKFYYINSGRELWGALKSFFLLFYISYRQNLRYVISTHTHCNSLLGLMRLFGLLKCQYLISRESTTYIERYHGIKLRIARFFYKIGYRSQDLVICQTSRMQQGLLKLCPFVSKRNISVIANPVSVASLDSMLYEASPEWLQNRRYVISAGRLIHVKGYDLLIEAFSLYVSNGGLLDLILIGEGEERGNLESLISQHNLSSRVFLPGRQSNPALYYKSATLGIVSSRVEGFPNVLLEMMAVCPRVISTRCAGDMDNIPGITLCEANSHDIFKAIDKVLNQSIDDDHVMRNYVMGRSPASYWMQIKAGVGH
jgi:glycosyltransferase involved in cell wall biosynthesis